MKSIIDGRTLKRFCLSAGAAEFKPRLRGQVAAGIVDQSGIHQAAHADGEWYSTKAASPR